MAALLPLIEALVPALVAAAIKLFPGSSDQQSQWVSGFVTDMVTQLEKKFSVPSWATTLVPDFETFLTNLIQTELAKVGA